MDSHHFYRYSFLHAHFASLQHSLPVYLQRNTNALLPLCKEPIYRKTPLGREITDLLVAINRPYNKSDYIPSIVWGRNAKFAKTLKVGDRIQMWGRVQSREYEKKVENGEAIKKVAYEVSISKIKKLSENNSQS